MGCLRDDVGITTGVPRIAAHLLQRPSRWSRAKRRRSAPSYQIVLRRPKEPLFVIVSMMPDRDQRGAAQVDGEYFEQDVHHG